VVVYVLAYVGTEKIEALAVCKFKMYSQPITYTDLISKGLASGKHQAQLRLRYNLKKDILFTLRDHRPQKYFPKCMEAEVRKKELSTYMQPSGVTSSKSPPSNFLEPIILQSLEGYVLPLLPAAPMMLHNIHLKTAIPPDYYNELKFPMHKRNNGKYTEQPVANTLLTFIFSPNGTVQAIAQCSNNPFKIETELDRSRLLIYYGQIKETLAQILSDNHQRAVADIPEWYLTECDINKDIKVSHLLQLAGLKIQVKHLDHLFRIYIKCMGPDTVCRVEQNCHFKANKPVIEGIEEIFNPNQKLENKIDFLIGRFQEMMKSLPNVDTVAEKLAHFTTPTD